MKGHAHLGAERAPDCKAYFQTYFDQRSGSNLEAYREPRHNFLGHCYNKRLEVCLAWLRDSGLPTPSRILDVGCGASPLVHEVTHLGHRAWGADHSFHMLQDAHGDSSPRFLQADAEAIPFADAVFDAVFCLGVLCYLPGDHRALAELARITRPDGLLVLSLPQKINLAAMVDFPFYLRKKVAPLLRRPPAGSTVARSLAFDERSYTISRINRLLRQAGFDPEEWRTLRFGPFTLLDRPLFTLATTIRLSRLFEALHRVPGIRGLGEWYLVKARRDRS